MKANSTYAHMPKPFWAAVRTISQELRYTVWGVGTIKVPTVPEMKKAFKKLDLDPALLGKGRSTSKFGHQLANYYYYRADVLQNHVEPRLMNVEQAANHFNRLRKELNPSCPLPMNKQKREKKAPAYLTGIVNMLVEANSAGYCCDYDPRSLTTVTVDGTPIRTLARRVDGALPSTVNPVAIWEIKEYYYTTTFGSRVADGVYESLLDGMELEELNEHQNIKVEHCLMIDAHYTWWECGKSYLCRIIDMLNMGYVDEVLFGSEVIERLPSLVREWTQKIN